MSVNDVKTLELRRKWTLDSAIGSGGFGRIYEAKGDDGSAAVIKLIPKLPGAARELLFESLSNHTNVIPILDSGEWNDHYVLVMPRAEKSLRQHLLERQEKLPLNESLEILLDVIEALAGLSQDIVHRDLKPENILFFQGHWCLADFGISRYVEATTAQDTRKGYFTVQYAAPEQWRHERATPATDVYAFGVLAFELLQGRRPFPGPTMSDYQQQHLHQQPPSLTGIPPSIASLITECLYKAPQARPTAANILARLRKSQHPLSPAAARLQVVNQAIIDKQAQADAIDSANKSLTESRKDLFSVARQSFQVIIEELVEQICDAAPSAIVSRSPYLKIQLGSGTLTFTSPDSASPNCLAVDGYEPPFDVIAFATITVQKPRDRFNYEGRSHSLWFCDAYDEGLYRWFETAFMEGLFAPHRGVIHPFALSPLDQKAAYAFSHIMSEYQPAWEPLPFDQGDEEQFIERWIGWLVAAVDGSLRLSSQMPERSGGHHREAKKRV